MRFSELAGLLALAFLLRGDVRDCACDVAKPETMSAPSCGLCREAEAQSPDTVIFFLKDINPRKPNRWLALPRAHTHALQNLSPEAQLALWNAAIEKAKSMWGDQWGLAMNGDERRTQCHAHLHIGKLMEGVETPNFVEVDGAPNIAIPTDGTGIWVHPVGAKLHVHTGEQVTETVLMR